MKISAKFRLSALRALFLLCAVAMGVAAAAEKKPVLLYTRYFNAEGENRYSPDTTYKDILDRLRSHFDVRTDSKPLTERSLAGVNVVFIANPSDKAVPGHPAPHHFGQADIDVIGRFFQRGG